VATVRVRDGSRGRTYQVQVRSRGHRPITKTFHSLTMAKKWGRDTEARLERGEGVSNEAHKHTVEQAIDRFLKQRPELGTAQYNLRWWKREHGHVRLSAVTRAWLQEVRDDFAASTYTRGKGKKKTTHRMSAGAANRNLTYLRAVLAEAVRWGWILQNPASGISKLTEPRGRVRFLSDEERQALLKACQASPSRALYPLVVAAISSGARAGELLALRWSDVDLAKGIGVIHDSKNGEARRLYFRGIALDALKDLNKVRHLKSDLVFTTDGGTRYQYYNQDFATAREAAKVADFRFHDLRHTAASYLAQSGATLLEIAEVLGHKTLQMTQRYSHLTSSHVADVVDRAMQKRLGGGSS